MTTMEMRKIGSLSVSVVGLGCNNFGGRLDSEGTAAVVQAALDAGIVRFDASLGGLGGCPYAPGATGNVCTEELVHMLELDGYDTGVDLTAVLDAARSLPELIGHDVPSQLLKAGHRLALRAMPAIAGEAPS